MAADDPIEIKASGTMLLRQGGGGNGFESNPSGNQNYRDGNHAPGQLLARVGKSGRTFSVGEHYKGAPGETGRLYLRVHPSPWGNQMTGNYAIKVIHGGGVEGRTPVTPKSESKVDFKDIKVP